MRVFDIASQLGSLFRKRTRRVSVGTRRGHVEFRDVAPEELTRLVGAVQGLAQELEYLEWVEVNAHSQRVVFAFKQGAYGDTELVALVEKAERLARVSEGVFDKSPAHPADDELGARRLVEAVADASGFWLGLGLRVSPIPTVPGIGNLVAVLSLVRSSPRLRRGLEERWGVERAEFLLNLSNSMLQSVAQRPMTSLVDGVHKYELIREIRAQRSVWAERDEELHLVPPSDGDGAVGVGQEVPRPCPLPRGPIEEYADRAWAVSLSGFALSFLTTRSIQRATAALFGGLPRPARVGRDVFAAELSGELAKRGILVLDPRVLRRLDRISCLVLQGDLVSLDRFVVGGILAEDPEEVEGVRERVGSMFDNERPLELRVDGLWRLLPWGATDATKDPALQEHAARRLQEGALLLSLERAGRAVAVVEVEIVARTGVEELIAVAQEAQLRVVVASSDETVVDRLQADDVITDQEGIRAGVRRLQREGYGVALVATGSSAALPLADCAIGICRDGEPSPWGADMIARRDLADVRFILQACVAARRLSKQAVNLALGAATMGALISAGGILPMTTRRVLFVVNSAALLSMANGARASHDLSRLELPEPRDPTPWHALDAEGVLARLGTSSDGLARSQISRRVVLAPRKASDAQALVEAITDELFNPFAPLLAAGAGLSAVVGSLADASMVAGVVGLNALVGGVQRFRTERKIRELSDPEAGWAHVIRDGGGFRVDASDLVSGDVIAVGPGDLVPADCRLIETQSLEVDASSLTGESLPVPKSVTPSFEANLADRDCMLYQGTAIASGHAKAVVVAVGDATEARRGAAVAKTRAQGGVEHRLRALMDLTVPIALAAGVGVVGGGMLRGRRLSELVGSGVSLAVASVPEGLPLLATAAQLASAQRLSKRKALVRNGRSIEALGRVNTICFDKTGTVTRGRIELSSISDGELHEFVAAVSQSRRDVLAAALRASSPRGRGAIEEPTDEALFRAGDATALGVTFAYEDWSRLSELSFESGRSYHATLGQIGEARLVSVKGAPEVILPMCAHWRRGASLQGVDDGVRYSLAVQATRLARRGLRVLAVAERRLAGGTNIVGDGTLEQLEFLGFLAFNDPVRPSARVAIAGLQSAGVSSVMITGDHPSTAEAIAVELGLLDGRRVITGGEMAKVEDDVLDGLIDEIGVFARVTPAQKVRVVRALQRAGKVVAMAGDGSNDAPAIRMADVGVAVGQQSTAAARGAADIILADGRIETLVEAIKEGRAMWSSVRDAVSILIGGNLGEIGFTTAVGLISGRPALNARQLLLVNLLTDVAPAMAIALKPPSQDTLDNLANEGPEASLAQPLNRDIALRASLTTVGASSAWVVARLTGGRARARTVALAALVGTQLTQTLATGRGDLTVTATSVGSAALLAAMIQTPGLSHFFGCRPLGPVGWATAFGASAAAASLPALSSWLVELMKQRMSVEPGALVAAPTGELTVGSQLSQLPAGGQ